MFGGAASEREPQENGRSRLASDWQSLRVSTSPRLDPLYGQCVFSKLFGGQFHQLAHCAQTRCDIKAGLLEIAFETNPKECNHWQVELMGTAFSDCSDHCAASPADCASNTAQTQTQPRLSKSKQICPGDLSNLRERSRVHLWAIAHPRKCAFENYATHYYAQFKYNHASVECDL